MSQATDDTIKDSEEKVQAVFFLLHWPVDEGMCMVPEIDRTTADVQWYQCHDWGHIALNCPNSAPNAAPISSSFIMQRMWFTQDEKATKIERSWILLDTFSTNSTS